MQNPSEMTTGATASPIAALEQQPQKEVFGKFVKGEVIQTTPTAPLSTSSAPLNTEVIKLDEPEDEEKEIDIAQKDVPDAVFGGLKRKQTTDAGPSRKKR